MKEFPANILRGFILFLSWTLFRPKVYYKDKSIQKNKITQPILMVCNHTCHMDGPVIGSIFWKDKIHYLAAKDRFESKPLAWLMRQCRCIPIDRRDLDTSWIHGACNLLSTVKEPLCIFPEGRHGKNGEILPFHSGVTMLAFIARVPVLLVYIHHSYGFLFGKRAKVMVDIPRQITISPEGLSSDFVDHQTKELRNQMLELQQEFYRQTKIQS